MTEQLTIPAASLADAQTALTEALSRQSRRLRNGYEFERPIDPDDRRAGVRAMGQDTRMLEQLIDATADTTVTGENDQFYRLLEGIARGLLTQLADHAGRYPLELDEVSGLAQRLQWATAEAARLTPPANPENEGRTAFEVRGDTVFDDVFEDD
jgi:hypothetical protein